MKFTVLAKLYGKGNPPTLVVPASREMLYIVIFNGADFIFA
jgi:hypothetical protein